MGSSGNTEVNSQEFTDSRNAGEVAMDAQSEAGSEDEVWVTETSEMVHYSFVTETVRIVETDDDGNEVVEEVVKYYYEHGNEVTDLSNSMLSMLHSPSVQ